MVNVLAVVAISLLVGSVLIGYLTYKITKREHEDREYALTWAIGIGFLFLMGIGPAAVGIGLYLTVERNYPLYWLLALAVAGLLASVGLTLAVTTGDAVQVVGTISSISSFDSLS